ncbi:hypothetical protein LX36DRAFT_713428 [Colletotrichum falcatum]|nr:hypothetical protein LX36DRAFT_713428 [Colletotrichum falcatum]
MSSPWESFEILSNDFSAADEVLSASDNGLGHLTESSARNLPKGTKAKSFEGIETSRAYNDLASSGNDHGPGFERLKEAQVVGRHGAATIVAEDIAEGMPPRYIQPQDRGYSETLHASPSPDALLQVKNTSRVSFQEPAVTAETRAYADIVNGMARVLGREDRTDRLTTNNV